MDFLEVLLISPFSNRSSGCIYVKYGSGTVVPFDYGMRLSDRNIGVLSLFSIPSLGVYGINIVGRSSN